MLRVTAPATEIARLGEVLRALAATDGEGFDALFAPTAVRMQVRDVDAAIVRELLAFGLVAGTPELIEGLHRIRRVGARFYVLELGGTLEYVQDVWPETDALLEAIARAPVGRLADVGTGSGVLAVEAAARGHRVVATDLYDTALQLARFNAILNGLDVIDFRRGHLFEPLPARAFDLVVTAPHYGREADQLRLEVFRDGPAVLGDGGRLVLASQLEWQGDGPLAVEPLLRAIAARGPSVRIAPIDSELKRNWHLRAISVGGEDTRLVSRWRFTVEIANDGRGEFAVTRPAVESLPTRVHVPLGRLRDASAGAAWTIARAADVDALGAELARLDEDELTIDAPLPSLLLDACRFGARPCVAPRGQAAGAILDVDGGVRPCTHGEPLARGDDSLATLLANQEAAAARSYVRRGCRDCAVVASCPRCLYPAPFADEAAYCTFMRAHATTLPRFRRLVETLARLGRRGGEPPVRAPLAASRPHASRGLLPWRRDRRRLRRPRGVAGRARRHAAPVLAAGRHPARRRSRQHQRARRRRRRRRRKAALARPRRGAKPAQIGRAHPLIRSGCRPVLVYETAMLVPSYLAGGRWRSVADKADVSLVNGAAAGDRDCLAALYDRYAPALLAIGRRILGDRREAEDLLHDVFIEVWRQAGDYDEARGSVRAWLLMRMRSRALDRRKAAVFAKRADLPAPEAIADALGDVHGGEDPALGPDRQAVRRALAQLPAEQRQVLELGYFEGMSSSEIAERVRAPIGTVKSRVAAALSKLRAAVEAPR